MSFTFYLCILALIIQVSISFLVILKDPKKHENQIFTLLLLFFSALTLAELYIIYSGLDETKVKLLMTPCIYLPYIFCIFAALFPEKQTDTIFMRSKLHFALFLVPAIAITALLWQGNLISLVSPINEGFAIVWTKYEFLLKAIIVSYLGIALSILSKSSKCANTKIKQRRLKYTFTAILLPITVGAAYIALSKFYMSGSTVYTFGLFPILSILMGIVLGYAMLKYNLLEIDIIFSIGIVYSLLTVILAGSMELLQELMQNILNLSGIWAKIVSTLFIAAIFSPLKEIIISLVDRFFGKKSFNAAHAMKLILDETRKAKTEEGVISSFLSSLSFTIESTFISVNFQNGISMSYPANKAPLELTEVELEENLNELDSIITYYKNNNKDETNLVELKAKGVTNLFKIYKDKVCIALLLIGMKSTKLQYTQQETSLIDSSAAELPHILDHIKMINKLIKEEKTTHEIAWAKKMLHSISAPNNLLEFSNDYNIITHSSLAPNVKGDMIDFCKTKDDSFIGVYDALNHGIQAVLTLNILFSVFRASKEKIFTANNLLKQYSELSLSSAVTLVYSNENDLIITNAGNPSPILVSSDCTPQEIIENGVPLGLDGMKSFTKRVSLEKNNGNFLLIATNGLHKLFEQTDLISLNTFLTNNKFDGINSCHEKIIKLIENLVQTSELLDDITYILIERKK